MTQANPSTAQNPLQRFTSPKQQGGGDYPDPRLHAYRSDLADIRLEGTVRAMRYTAGKPMRVTASIVPLLREANSKAAQISQLLHGEAVTVFEEADGWAWVQAEADDYVGYTPATGLSTVVPDDEATHMVVMPITHLYRDPDIKCRPLTTLYAGSPIHLDGGEARGTFAKCEGGWVTKSHIEALPDPMPQNILPIAKSFLGSPYLWGGRTHAGIDCSGLVQTVLRLCGMGCPRDSDMQAVSVGTDKGVDLASVKAGDIVFFPGHVGFMVDEENLLHANATHMAVTIDPLEEVIKTISRDLKDPVTAVKRLS